MNVIMQNIKVESAGGFWGSYTEVVHGQEQDT